MADDRDIDEQLTSHAARLQQLRHLGQSVHGRLLLETCGLMCRVGQKLDHIYTFIMHVCDDVGRRSIYQNVQFFIKSKILCLNVAIFINILCICSHKLRDTKMPIN